MGKIKKLIRACGFEIVRTRNERVNLFQAVQHLKNLGFRPSLIIDAGVADGTPGIYKNYPESRVLLIEPLKEYKNSLDSICKKYTNYIPIAMALGSDDGEIDLYVKTKNSGSSQYKHDNEDIVEKRCVSSITLKTLLSEYRTDGPILLKMDIEGGELDVIKNSENEMKYIDVVILEAAFLPKLDDCPSFMDLIKVMIGYGFETFDIIDKRYYQTSRNLFQADIVFVKKESYLRKKTS